MSANYANSAAALESFDRAAAEACRRVAAALAEHVLPALARVGRTLTEALDVAIPPDERAFLAALAENPADATARLVYADWLDERDRAVEAARQRVLAEPGEDRHRLAFADASEAAGDGARAEFVRVQVEMARLKVPRIEGVPLELLLGAFDVVGDAKVAPVVKDQLAANIRRGIELQKRERELWDGGLATVFLDESSPINGVHLKPVREEILVRVVGKPVRGFIGQVTGPAADWIRHGDAVCAAHPVERVRLTTMPEGVAGGVDPGTSRPPFTWNYEVAGRTVTLSERDWVGLGNPRAMMPGDVRGAIKLIWERRWPGVTVEMPKYGVDPLTRPWAGEPVVEMCRGVGRIGPGDPLEMVPMVAPGGRVAGYVRVLTDAALAYGVAETGCGEEGGPVRVRRAGVWGQGVTGQGVGEQGPANYAVELERVVQSTGQRSLGVRDYRCEFVSRAPDAGEVYRIDHRCENGITVRAGNLTSPAPFRVIDCRLTRVLWERPVHVGAPLDVTFYAGRCDACRTAFFTEPEVRPVPTPTPR